MQPSGTPLMTGRKRQGFQRALLDWYARNARDLPFRRTRDPYRIYLAEIMLQQTRVDQGLPYYERFLEQFPSLTALAAASGEAVLKAWEGLGYYSRARNLHRTARTLVEAYGGKFPEDIDVLQRLPGIGRYTAGAIASIAFGKQVPVLDGNVKRVLARLYKEEDPVASLPVEKRLWEYAAALVPPEKPGDFNQAMMELGACICLPRVPRCAACPARRYCAAFEVGIQESLPVRPPVKAVPQHEVVVAAIRRGGRYLIGRRPQNGLLGGLWEFPGGKIIPGENSRDALIRECREELGVTVKVGEPVAVLKHAYTHFRVTLHVYRCSIKAGKITAAFHEEVRWVFPAEFAQYAFPKANHKFLHLLLEEASGQ